MNSRYTGIIGTFVVVTVIIGVGHIAAASVSVSHLCFKHVVAG